MYLVLVVIGGLVVFYLFLLFSFAVIAKRSDQDIACMMQSRKETK